MGFLLTEPCKLKQVISGLRFQVGKVSIPRILLGTSPFIGAGQFGGRAMSYRAHFYENPRNILKLMRKVVELGVSGIQALPYPPILSALEVLGKELEEELTIVGTVGPDEPLMDISDFQDFNTPAMLLHAQLTDRRDSGEISGLLDEIRSVGCLAGLASHEPHSTLKWLIETRLEFDLLMLPINKLGAFMDANPLEIANTLKRIHKPVIGKKVLAAGNLDPSEALKFIGGLGCVDAIALGVASEQEAGETFAAAAAALSNSSNVQKILTCRV